MLLLNVTNLRKYLKKLQQVRANLMFDITALVEIILNRGESDKVLHLLQS